MTWRTSPGQLQQSLWKASLQLCVMTSSRSSLRHVPPTVPHSDLLPHLTPAAQQPSSLTRCSPPPPDTPPPLCSELRIQELAQPKTAYWDKHARAKEEAEAAQLSSIPFKPRTGRGPRHRQGPQGPVEERLHGAHDALKLER